MCGVGWGGGVFTWSECNDDAKAYVFIDILSKSSLDAVVDPA